MTSRSEECESWCKPECDANTITKVTQIQTTKKTSRSVECESWCTPECDANTIAKVTQIQTTTKDK